jgi:crotonobetainyl-CoA:carnitine CoA-transferase CaiB-like acyl-CoA transferase
MGQPPSPVRRRYRCRDGYLRLELRSPQEWQALAKCLGRPELAYPGSWEVAAAAPPRGRLGRLLEALFRREPVEVWLRRLEAHGVPCRPD